MVGHVTSSWRQDRHSAWVRLHLECLQQLERNWQVMGGRLCPEVTPPSITGTRLSPILPHFSHFSKSWIWQISAYFNLLPIFCVLLTFYFEKISDKIKSTNQYKQFMFTFIQISKTVESFILASSFFLLSQEFFLKHLIISFWIMLWYPSTGSPHGTSSKEPTCSAGDTRDSALIPGLGRFPGGGNGNPLRYSCLQNLMDRGAWWAIVHRVAKSWTQLKRLSMHACKGLEESVGVTLTLQD